ncbi:cytochrome P450 704C1-like [Aristolochia californica]|uniref:cytochrome P450 704C1-like n=1 Tax=Aristolochia californica TaxID=171875 RepID=UPI0035D8719F
MDFCLSALVATGIPIFLLLISFFIFLLRIFTGKSTTNPLYAPAVATVFHQLFYFDNLFDYLTDFSRRYPTFRLLGLKHSELYTVDPRNVEHILKTKFDNYPKGQYTYTIVSDLFGDGIFAVDGDKWRKQRKLASFEFSTRVLRDFSCGIFRKNSIKLALIVHKFSEERSGFDIQDLLMKCALDSIFEVGFGVDLNCLEGSSKSASAFIKAFDESNALVYWRYADFLWKIKRRLNVGSEARLRKNIDLVDDFVYSQIRNKRERHHNLSDDNVKEDLLSRFLAESERDPENMKDRHLRNIILNFIIAGKDSTANTLSWFFYMLCKHPSIQEKVFQQVRDVIQEDKKNMDDFVSKLTDGILEKMHYLHAALTETLRLYPAVPIDGKCAEVDDVLPDGFRLNKGDGINYMAYAMGRMKTIWGEDAEEFRPERWIENGIFRPESSFKFVAFHAGPRICLGKEFAYRQMKIISMVLLHYFRFQLEDEKKEVKYKTMFTLHLDGGLHLQAFSR